MALTTTPAVVRYIELFWNKSYWNCRNPELNSELPLLTATYWLRVFSRPPRTWQGRCQSITRSEEGLWWLGYWSLWWTPLGSLSKSNSGMFGFSVRWWLLGTSLQHLGYAISTSVSPKGLSVQCEIQTLMANHRWCPRSSLAFSRRRSDLESIGNIGKHVNLPAQTPNTLLNWCCVYQVLGLPKHIWAWLTP